MKYNLLLLSLIISSPAFCQINNLNVSNSFKAFVEGGTNNNSFTRPAGSMITFNPKEDTEGSPYLFKNWAKGEVHLKTMQVFTEPTNVLNYDKTKGEIVVKLNDQKVIDVNMEQIESFVLRDGDSSKIFLQRPEKPGSFYLQVYRDSLCNLFKTVETKFYKADYVNKGLYESGYKYDRYVDQYVYFVQPNGQPPIAVKNTSKRELSKIVDQIAVAKKYISENAMSADAETYLTNLVIFLNKATTSR